MTMIVPNKFLGQHFLTDKAKIYDICLGVKNIFEQLKHDKSLEQLRFIEIGPGTGNLTRALLSHINYTLTCIEKDERFPKIQGTDWIIGDALDYPFTPQDFVVGNLPYNISTQLFERFVRARIGGWWVMVQKEVADRVVTQNGKNYGRLSVLMQSVFQTKYQFTVSPSSFLPSPKVNSACISGVRRERECDITRLCNMTRVAFGHRRKKLSNVLHEELARRFAECGVDLAKRAENVSVEEFLMIAGND